MKCVRRQDGWWVLGGPFGEQGPYATKAEALEVKRRMPAKLAYYNHITGQRLQMPGRKQKAGAQ